MISSKRWFTLLISGVLCAVILAVGSLHAGGKPRKVRLAYDGLGVGATIAWVAKEAGLFKKYDLDVEQIFIRDTSTGGIQALLGVDILLGSGNPITPIQTILGGADIVFLGSHVNMEHYGLGVSPDIASIKQLKGKKIGVSGLGTLSDLIARVILRRAGLDPLKDVKMVVVGYSPQRAIALSKNLIQGAPLASQAASEAKRQGLKVLNVKEVPIITTLLVTTRSFIQRDEEAVRRFMKGYLTAIHYYLTHRDESIRIMEKYVTATEPTTLEAMYHTFAAQLEPLPAPNGEALQALIDTVSVIDQRALVLKLVDLFDLRFLKELKASGFVESLYSKKIKI